MILDDLKREWKQYGGKLERAAQLNEKIINAMIMHRSKSRWSGVKKQYIAGVMWMVAWIILGIAILVGNPFDYIYPVQFAPIVIYVLCLLALTTAMVRAFLALNQITFSSSSLDVSLKQVVDIYEKPGTFATWTLRILIFSSTVLFPLSFLPKKLNSKLPVNAIGETVMAMAISATILFIAHKLGAFKSSAKDRFKEDLTELNELKMMVKELNN